MQMHLEVPGGTHHPWGGEGEKRKSAARGRAGMPLPRIPWHLEEGLRPLRSQSPREPAHAERQPPSAQLSHHGAEHHVERAVGHPGAVQREDQSHVGRLSHAESRLQVQPSSDLD